MLDLDSALKTALQHLATLCSATGAQITTRTSTPALPDQIRILSDPALCGVFIRREKVTP